MIPQKVARWQFAIRRNAKRRFRSGPFPVCERRELRKKANLVIGKTAFVRLCQFVASEIGHPRLRFEGDAIDTIQEPLMLLRSVEKVSRSCPPTPYF
ncbi:hypothetical protein Trisim1_009436 [Trichoderma cf. simile WF8]